CTISIMYLFSTLSILYLISMSFHLLVLLAFIIFFFFFNDTATTEIYTLSLHDALPIYFHDVEWSRAHDDYGTIFTSSAKPGAKQDRKSTRLNSSHGSISYAVFCLKKKKKPKKTHILISKKKSQM